jgi:mRNA interferase MazF
LDQGREQVQVINVRCGELVTVAVSGDYGKPRPALIIQADAFDSLSSVTVAPLTSEIYQAPLFRVTIQPGKETGLRRVSQVMVDKITTVPRAKIGQRMGSIEASTLRAVNLAIKGFLDLE